MTNANDILEIIITNQDKIHIDTCSYLMYRIFSCGIFDFYKHKSLLTYVLSRSEIYANDYRCNFYNIMEKAIHGFYEKKNVTDSRYNWYIGNIIDIINSDQQYHYLSGLQYFIELSKFSIKKLVYLDKINQINYTWFDIYFPMIRQNLQWISIGTNYKYHFADLVKEYIDYEHKTVHKNL
jgi:hypothetical protein